MKVTVKIDNQRYEVEIDDLRARPVVARVDGEVFEIWPEEQVGASSRPVVPAPPAAPTAEVMARHASSFAPVRPDEEDAHPTIEGGAFTVRAPIPGVITAVLVNPGDKVSSGQVLCSLEAMKMNNAIRASRSGIIGNVLVSVGQAVKHNDGLIEFAE